MSGHSVDPGVVMIGIVMKQEESFDFGLQSKSDDIIETAVAPADVIIVLLRIILAVHDQHVRAMEKIAQLLIFLARVFRGRWAG